MSKVTFLLLICLLIVIVVWRLDASVDDIETLFRIHKMIRNKSLVYLCENIKIADKLGFTKEKMLKYGYLLHNYPNYTKTVLRTMPFIAGVDLARSMRIYPKLVMVSPRNYKIIYKYLKVCMFLGLIYLNF